MYTVKMIDGFSTEIIELFSKNPYTTNHSDQINGLLVRSSVVPDTKITKDLIAISRAGVGTNTINIEKCTENGTAVLNTPGSNANAVKELVLASLFLSIRPILSAAEHVQKLDDTDILKEAEGIRSKYIGRELQGKTIGLLGLGAIGKQVGRSCYELGMNVLGFARTDHHLDYLTQVALNELLTQSDFVVVLLPLTKETTHLLNEKTLTLMKKGAYLLNFGRDGIVENSAVMNSLTNGTLSKYITDFPQKEFLGNPNVIMLPHIGGNTVEAIKDGEHLASRHLQNFLFFGTVRDSPNFPSIRLLFRSSYRLTIFYKDTKKIWAKIVEIITRYDLEIGDMASNKKDKHVYTLIDLEADKQQQLKNVIKEIENLSAVKRVRLLERPHIDKIATF